MVQAQLALQLGKIKADFQPTLFIKNDFYYIKDLKLNLKKIVQENLCHSCMIKEFFN